LAFFTKFVVIPSGDAECCYVGKIAKWNVDNGTLQTTALLEEYVEQNITVLQYRGPTCDPPNTFIDLPVDIVSQKYTDTDISGWGATEVISNVSLPDTVMYEVEVKLVTPHGTYDVGGGNTEEAFTYWSQFGSASILFPCSASGLGLTQSYDGTGLKRNDFASELTGGFDADGATIRWVGRA
jgi:hypothetical protein